MQEATLTQYFREYFVMLVLSVLNRMMCNDLNS